jgi:hypothetical protein
MLTLRAEERTKPILVVRAALSHSLVVEQAIDTVEDALSASIGVLRVRRGRGPNWQPNRGNRTRGSSLLVVATVWTWIRNGSPSISTRGVAKVLKNTLGYSGYNTRRAYCCSWLWVATYTPLLLPKCRCDHMG